MTRFLLLIFVLQAFNPTTTLNTISISDLTNNPGLLSLKTGNSFLKVGNHKLFHIIDFNTYDPIFNKLSVIINGLKSFKNSSDLTALLETKLNNAHSLLHNMHAKGRSKRGLFNFLGTGLKQITGNLDNNDLEEISNNIQKIREGHTLLVKQNNAQVAINLQLQDRINRVIKQLNEQQNQISKNLIAIKERSGSTENLFIMREVMKLGMNLDHLLKHLETIEEAVHFARLKIISKHILSPEELNFASRKIEEGGVEISNPAQVYEFLELNAFFNSSQLVFIILIPQIENCSYSNLMLEPLPIGNRILKLPSNVAIIGGNRTFFITTECLRIEKSTLCSKNNLLELNNDRCFSKLLRGLSGNCTFGSLNHVPKIRQLTSNLMLVVQIKQLEIRSTCGVRSRFLTGTFLIEFHNCSVTVNGSEFSNTELIRSEPPIVIPMEGLEIKEISFEPHTELEKLNITNRAQLASLDRQHKIRNYTSVSLSGISMILGIVAFFLIARNRRLQIKIQQDYSPTEDKPNTHRRSCSTNRDDSDFKEGLVTEGTGPNHHATIMSLLDQVEKQQQQLAALIGGSQSTQ